MAVSTITYRLRGGQINPALSSCAGTGVPEYFYIQTFGAEKIITDFDDAATELLASNDMQGQKPGDHDDPAYRESSYSSASYSSRPLRTTDGDLVFNATEVHVAEWIEEDQIGL